MKATLRVILEITKRRILRPLHWQISAETVMLGSRWGGLRKWLERCNVHVAAEAAVRLLGERWGRVSRWRLNLWLLLLLWGALLFAPHGWHGEKVVVVVLQWQRRRVVVKRSVIAMPIIKGLKFTPVLSEFSTCFVFNWGWILVSTACCFWLFCGFFLACFVLK